MVYLKDDFSELPKPVTRVTVTIPFELQVPQPQFGQEIHNTNPAHVDYVLPEKQSSSAEFETVVEAVPVSEMAEPIKTLGSEALDEGVGLHNVFHDEFVALFNIIIAKKQTRERAICLTKLQECKFWFEAIY